MTWLFHNYFLPTLNPSAAPQGQKTTLRPLTPVLKRYKGLLKLTTRDASLRAQYHPEINAVLRDVERWVAEARVAASVEGFGDVLAEDEDQDQDQDVKELWALEKLCDALMEPGILVPLSKKCHLSLFPPSIFRSQTAHTLSNVGNAKPQTHSQTRALPLSPSPRPDSPSSSGPSSSHTSIHTTQTCLLPSPTASSPTFSHPLSLSPSKIQGARRWNPVHLIPHMMRACRGGPGGSSTSGRLRTSLVAI
jgi:hypothetical protein